MKRLREAKNTILNSLHRGKKYRISCPSREVRVTCRRLKRIFESLFFLFSLFTYNLHCKTSKHVFFKVVRLKIRIKMTESKAESSLPSPSTESVLKLICQIWNETQRRNDYTFLENVMVSFYELYAIGHCYSWILISSSKNT